MVKCAGGWRSWLAKLLMQRAQNAGNRIRRRRTILSLVRVADVANHVCEQDAPRRNLFAVTLVPNANVDRAVQTLFSNPRAQHLHGVGVALGCWGDDEWLHEHVQQQFSDWRVGLLGASLWWVAGRVKGFPGGMRYCGVDAVRRRGGMRVCPRDGWRCGSARRKSRDKRGYCGARVGISARPGWVAR